MEQLTEIKTNPSFSAARKKRSYSRRRPHPNLQLTGSFTVPSLPESYGGHEDASYCLDGSSMLEPDSRSSLHSAEVVVGLTDQFPEPARVGNVKKLKKLKLKLGGVTRTLHTKSTTENAIGDEPIDADGGVGKQPQASSLDYSCDYDVVYQSKRVAKKHASDEEFDEEDDEEIRYLMKLRASKVAYGSGNRQEDKGRKIKGNAKLTGGKHSDVVDYATPESGKDGKKKPRMYEDNDCGMEMGSDVGLKSRTVAEDFLDLSTVSGQEMMMTTRKRALECPEFGGLVEFPNGLPDAPSKKQKLTEVEQQLRKAEAAQRRRLQAEKAAKEAEAEAIKRILEQDSNRKKKEEKLKKRQEEAQERSVKDKLLEPNTIRLTMGPNGTVLTFSEDLGLPKIFHPPACRYPPPREKCVGPNCTNAYKYRDSKSKLPLCSLHCYKAVQGNSGLLPAC